MVYIGPAYSQVPNEILYVIEIIVSSMSGLNMSQCPTTQAKYNYQWG